MGTRLGLLALKYLYGRDILADAPRFVSADRQGETVRLLFDNAGTGLSVTGNAIDALVISVAGKEIPYTYEIKGKELVVHLQESVSGSLRIAFAKTAFYQVNLYNESGIPAIPFETEC